MKKCLIISMVCVLLGAVSPVQAGYWSQPPNFLYGGVGVYNNDYENRWSGDDFLCEDEGWVNSISFHGAWYDNLYPNGDSSLSKFKLSICEDIPAGEDGIPYSRPGGALWSWEGFPDLVLQLPQAALSWYNPYTGVLENPYWFDVYSYSFDFTEGEAFVQTGTEADPEIYWLTVSAIPMFDWEEVFFSWVSSWDHWNDAAVRSAGAGVQPLKYPPGYDYTKYPDWGSWPDHKNPNDPMDLAFNIRSVPEPATICLLGLGSLALLRRKRNA